MNFWQGEGKAGCCGGAFCWLVDSGLPGVQGQVRQHKQETGKCSEAHSAAGIVGKIDHPARKTGTLHLALHFIAVGREFPMVWKVRRLA